MRAIILAAGRGMRLQHAEDQQLPKRLLRFARVSLLERHLQEASEPGFTNSSPQGRWIDRVAECQSSGTDQGACRDES
ncbi:MAG: hypothetical protein JWM63_3430 [Gammaproteobacteria bacterium]|jgi:hypothetical protein|nr:hypothetical protein [Gammaproteobacteria bacterium]